MPTSDADCSVSACACETDSRAYMCIDWTLGSSLMTSAETAFRSRTGIDVRFGVGTCGCLQAYNLGGCYRISYAGLGSDPSLHKDLIVQAVNTGPDVHCPQFDVQVGVGGQGIHNNCGGSGTEPLVDLLAMFDAVQSQLGDRYGGHRNRAGCSLTPRKPQHNPSAVDDVVEMCELSFDAGLRGEGGENPVITRFSQVTCPAELTEITVFRRADQDHFGFEHATVLKTVGSTAEALLHFNNEERLFYDNTAMSHPCGFTAGTGSGDYCLSRMMDCRKPSAAFKDNIHAPNSGNSLEAMCPGMSILPTCDIGGESRIASTCGTTECAW